MNIVEFENLYCLRPFYGLPRRNTCNYKEETYMAKSVGLVFFRKYLRSLSSSSFFFNKFSPEVDRDEMNSGIIVIFILASKKNFSDEIYHFLFSPTRGNKTSTNF